MSIITTIVMMGFIDGLAAVALIISLGLGFASFFANIGSGRLALRLANKCAAFLTTGCFFVIVGLLEAHFPIS